MIVPFRASSAGRRAIALEEHPSYTFRLSIDRIMRDRHRLPHRHLAEQLQATTANAQAIVKMRWFGANWVEGGRALNVS